MDNNDNEPLPWQRQHAYVSSKTSRRLQHGDYTDIRAALSDVYGLRDGDDDGDDGNGDGWGCTFGEYNGMCVLVCIINYITYIYICTYL